MKSPRAKHSKKASPVARVLGFREASVRERPNALGDRGLALPAGETSAETHADVNRLMGQMREANERLIVAAIRAQDLSDEAHAEALQAKTDLDALMSQLRDANDRLAAGATEALVMAEEARQREEDYRRLSNRLLTLQDEERRRLALDLHDSTAQILAALAMNLAVIQGERAPLDARSRRALQESRSLADQCSREVRTLAYLLHPPLLEEMGLLSAVRWFAQGFTKRSGIRVAMDLSEVGRLPRSIETALFRVVQESLTNAHRHASTKTVSVRLSSTANAIALEIKDQGHGLRDQASQQLAPEILGVGIQGMRERISQLNGTFGVDFTDTGTTVQVGVPLNADTQ